MRLTDVLTYFLFVTPTPEEASQGQTKEPACGQQYGDGLTASVCRMGGQTGSQLSTTLMNLTTARYQRGVLLIIPLFTVASDILPEDPYQ
jgi:hypothetical protein